MTIHIHNKQKWTDAFFEACGNGNLEEVRHLCQKQCLDQGLADIHCCDEYGFHLACKSGYFKIVKYLLASTELIASGHSLVNLHARDNEGFRLACSSGHLNIIKYLLTSPELIEVGHAFADVHAESDEGFFLACSHGHWDVVHWLIMDYGIEKTPAIKEIIKDHPQAQEYFRVREELKDIQTTLETSNPNPNPPSSETHNADLRATQKTKKL